MGGGRFLILDVIFLIGEEIAHAKPRQEPRPGRGRYGVEPLRSKRGEILDFGFFPAVAGRTYARIFDYWRVRKWKSENVEKWF